MRTVPSTESVTWVLFWSYPSKKSWTSCGTLVVDGTSATEVVDATSSIGSKSSKPSPSSSSKMGRAATNCPLKDSGTLKDAKSAMALCCLNGAGAKRGDATGRTRSPTSNPDASADEIFFKKIERCRVNPSLKIYLQTSILSAWPSDWVWWPATRSQEWRICTKDQSNLSEFQAKYFLKFLPLGTI